MTHQKEHVDAASLAKVLLAYALNPADPELQRECTELYLEELRILKLFSVDYVLGMEGVNRPEFASARLHYTEQLQHFCSSKSSPLTYRKLTARFTAYSLACNADTVGRREYKGKRMAFWELGKAFSRFASGVEPWVPNALQVVVHANLFASGCVRLAEFLEKYEVSAENL